MKNSQEEILLLKVKSPLGIEFGKEHLADIYFSTNINYNISTKVGDNT